MIIYDLLDTNEDILPGLTCGQTSALIILSVVVRALQHWRLAEYLSNYDRNITPVSPLCFLRWKPKKREVQARGLPCSLPTTNMIAGRVKDLSNNPRPQAKVPHPPVYLFFSLSLCSCAPAVGRDIQILSLCLTLLYTLYILSCL